MDDATTRVLASGSKMLAEFIEAQHAIDGHGVHRDEALSSQYKALAHRDPRILAAILTVAIRRLVDAEVPREH
jgi:hypothetical protein